MKQSFTIGKLAEAANVGIETIRYYQRRQLLPIPQIFNGAFRIYPPELLQRLRFIKRAQELGFSLDEIGSLLQLSEHVGSAPGSATSLYCEGHDSRQTVRRLAGVRLQQVQEKIRDLQKIQDSLAQLIEACANTDASQPCPIIEAFGTA